MGRLHNIADYAHLRACEEVSAERPQDLSGPGAEEHDIFGYWTKKITNEDALLQGLREESGSIQGIYGKVWNLLFFLDNIERKIGPMGLMNKRHPSFYSRMDVLHKASNVRRYWRTQLYERGLVDEIEYY
ncbi:hypothetical protein ACFL96_12595 [Thermoproteota archaeon]